MGYALFLGESIGLHKEYPEQVASYWSRLKVRAAFQQARKAEQRAAASQGHSAKSPMES